jgi:membrane protein DedA with SNARE-associated domain
MHFSAIIEHFHYLGLFIIIVLGGLGFPFPEGVTLIGCGFLISIHIVKLIPVLFITFTGVLTGDFLSYYFGKKYGHAIFAHKIFRKVISHERLSILEDRFYKMRIPFILIGGRLISGIFLVAGIVRMPLSKLLIYDAVSSTFAIIIWVGIGYISGNSLDIIKKDITRVEHMAILLITLLLIIFLFYKRFKPHVLNPKKINSEN